MKIFNFIVLVLLFLLGLWLVGTGINILLLVLF